MMQHIFLQEKVKRIKVAYEHLTENNEMYQQRGMHKCRCGYSAVTLRDLERHRQSGYTKVDGRAASSCNRFIWCCYCTDDVPYTVGKFSKHMLQKHGVIARICLPIVNQCPFCTFSRNTNMKTLQHVYQCRSLFKLHLNQYYPASMFDIPLLPKIRQDQPRYRTYPLPNATRAVSNLSSAVPGSVAFSPLPPVLLRSIAPVASPNPVPVALFAVTAGVMGHAARPPSFTGPAMATSYPIPQAKPAPATLPVTSVGMYRNTIAVNAVMPSLSKVTSSSSYPAPVQKPSIYGGIGATDQLQAALQSAFVQSPLHKPAGSSDQQTSKNVAPVGGSKVTKSIPVSAGSDNVTSLLQKKLLKDARVQIAGDLSIEGVTFTPYLPRKTIDKGSSLGVEKGSLSHSGSLPASSKPSVSSIPPSKKPDGTVTSVRRPVVVLRQLRVLACEICGSMFDKPLLLQKHLLKAHGIFVAENDIAAGSPRKHVQCVCCPLRFFSQQGLSRHMKIVHEILSDERTCTLPHCAATGIANLFEHFRVKHNFDLKTVVEWRVCYLCHLNFASLSEVEMHVSKAHKDVFPTRLHFRQAMRAAFRLKNRVNTQQLRRNPPGGSQSNGTRCPDKSKPVSDVSRKRHHSEIEIVQDSSDPKNDNSAMVQTADKQCSQLPILVIDMTSDEPDADAAAHSPGNEPKTKKARKSDGTSNRHTAECKSDHQSKTVKLHEKHSASGIANGAVLGTVTHRTEKEPAVVILPLTKERARGGSNTAKKPVGIPDVSVHLVPLISTRDSGSSVVPQTKGTSKSGSTTTATKPANISDVSVRLHPLDSMHDAKSAAVPLTRESTPGCSSKPVRTSDISLHVTPLHSSGTGESSVEKHKGRYRFV